MVPSFTDGRGRKTACGILIDQAQQGQRQLWMAGGAEAFPQVHAAGDAVRIELHLAVADCGGGVGESAKRLNLAG
jgi:hypothetical protein